MIELLVKSVSNFPNIEPIREVETSINAKYL